MEGKIRILNEYELVNGTDTGAVFPVTSDFAVYNKNNINLAEYIPHVNINSFTRNFTAFTAKDLARRSLRSEYRHYGQIITYYYDNTPEVTGNYDTEQADIDDSITDNEQATQNGPKGSGSENDSVAGPYWHTEQFYGNSFEDDVWCDDSNWKVLVSESGTGGGGAAGTLTTSSLNSQQIIENESLSGDVRLHRVSKTGRNTDLVNFVGKRYNADESVYTVTDTIYGEIFSTYSEDENRTPNIARGLGSAVFGNANVSDANGIYSISAGEGNYTNAQYSIVGGYNNDVKDGKSLLVTGTFNSINGFPYNSVVFGQNNTLSGNNSTVFGLGNITMSDNQSVLGMYDDYRIMSADGTSYLGDFAFIVGNGVSDMERSNAFLVGWNGVTWSQTDVICGGDVFNPTHKLSQKYDASNLITSITNIDHSTIAPVSYNVLMELYERFVGDHRAYFFPSGYKMVEKLLAQNPEVDFLTGDMLYVVGEDDDAGDYTYPAFFIANTDTANYVPYQYSTMQQLIDDIEAAIAGSDRVSTGLAIGFYRIGRIMNRIVLGDYQERLFDYLHPVFAGQVGDIQMLNLKTINGQSILRYNTGSDPTNIQLTVDTVDPNDTSLGVTGHAVAEYVNSQSSSLDNLKVLHTTGDESYEPKTSETLVTSDEDRSLTINLHKVSKTGKHVDLINYVGEIYNTEEAHATSGEIFNCYTGNGRNKAAGTYSHVEGCYNEATNEAMAAHVEGKGNVCSGQYSHVSGFNNIANSPYQFVIGKYNAPSDPSVSRVNDLFVIGGGNENARKNLFVVSENSRVWAEGKMYIGGTYRDSDTDTVLPTLMFDNNDAPNTLVHKYYVDHLCRSMSGLYKGIKASSASLPTNHNDNGSLYSVGQMDITLNNIQKRKHDVLYLYREATNTTGGQYYPLYDVINFTSDTSNIDDFYIVGGTQRYENSGVEKEDKTVWLHKIAKTGDYRDLRNTPTVLGFPSTHIKFVRTRMDAGNTSTIGSTNIRRYVPGQGEPEGNTISNYPDFYYDSSVAVIFDCNPQWVLDNILNNRSCRYSVYMQRVRNGHWQTVKVVKDTIPENQKKYRNLITPKNLNTLANFQNNAVINAYKISSGTWEAIDSTKKIGFILPYTVRDILMAFMNFHGCSSLWDLVHLGTAATSSSASYNADFAKKHFLLKGIDEVNITDDPMFLSLNAYSARFRIGVVEEDPTTGMYYGPSFWNEFKTVLKSDYMTDPITSPASNIHVLRCTGKLTTNKVKV